MVSCSAAIARTFNSFTKESLSAYYNWVQEQGTAHSFWGSSAIMLPLTTGSSFLLDADSCRVDERSQIKYISMLVLLASGSTSSEAYIWSRYQKPSWNALSSLCINSISISKATPNKCNKNKKLSAFYAKTVFRPVLKPSLPTRMSSPNPSYVDNPEPPMPVRNLCLLLIN